MLNVAEQAEPAIISAPVTVGRNLFLPWHLPGLDADFEQKVFSLIRKTTGNYTGGVWRYRNLSNDSLYVEPPKSKTGDRYEMDLSRIGISWKGHVEPEVAGIICSLFALGDLAKITWRSDIIEKYLALRDFASQHSKSSQILAAVY